MSKKYDQPHLPSVAVLLAAYNCEKWITEQISSILDQEKVLVSIFISLDISNEETIKKCQELAHKENVYLLPYGKKFGGAAPNFFRLIEDVNYYNYEYIALSDHDDIWNPSKLANGIQTLQLQACDGYSSNVLAYWPNKKRQLVDKSQKQTKWDYLFESSGPGCTFILTKKLAIDLKHFITNNKKELESIEYHDWFIYAFSRLNGYNWHIDKNPSMLYRQHMNNQVGVNSGCKAFIRRAKLVVNGKGIKHAISITKVLRIKKQNFVSKWNSGSRLGMIYLATHFWQCRRKKSEKLIFFFSCLILSIIGVRK